MKLTTQHPAWPLLRQTPGSGGRWGRYHFVVNEPVERCDFWVVCDGLLTVEETDCPPTGTVLVTWEPPVGVRRPYDQTFVDQFAAVLTCHRSLRHADARFGQQGHPWFVGRSLDQLDEAPTPPKSQQLVIITSDKAFSPAHRARLEFALALKDHFGADARLVGRGIEDFDDKWDVLAPARYAVAVENGVFDDWVTEKLPDCFLAGAFPLYHGAPNVSRYFPDASYEPVDVLDPVGACRVIERLLTDESHYERSLPHLVAAKNHYLQRLQLFPMLVQLLDGLAAKPDARGTRKVRLRPERTPSARLRGVAQRVLRR